jgi:hypothetical protein
MAPYDASRVGVVLSSVTTNEQGASTVAWSLSQHQGSRRVGDAYPLPAAMKPALGTRGAVIVAEVNFTYTPILSTQFLESIPMGQTFIAQPRIASAGVTCTAAGC